MKKKEKAELLLELGMTKVAEKILRKGFKGSYTGQWLMPLTRKLVTAPSSSTPQINQYLVVATPFGISPRLSWKNMTMRTPNAWFGNMIQLRKSFWSCKRLAIEPAPIECVVN